MDLFVSNKRKLRMDLSVSNKRKLRLDLFVSNKRKLRMYLFVSNKRKLRMDLAQLFVGNHMKGYFKCFTKKNVAIFSQVKIF